MRTTFCFQLPTASQLTKGQVTLYTMWETDKFDAKKKNIFEGGYTMKGEREKEREGIFLCVKKKCPGKTDRM